MKIEVGIIYTVTINHIQFYKLHL